MTVTTGFPDYGRQRVEAGPVLIDGQTVLDAWTSGVLYAGNYEYVTVYFDVPNTGSDYYDVTFSWYPASTAVSGPMTQDVVVGPGQYARVQFECLTQWVEVSVASATGAATNAATLWVVSRNGHARTYNGNGGSGPLIMMEDSLAAGASNFGVTDRVVMQPAVLNVAGYGTNNWRCIVEYWSWVSKAWAHFAMVDGRNGPNSGAFALNLSPAPYRLYLLNVGSSTYTLFASLS